MSNKITYGLSNVHVWPITATDEKGKATYGTVIPINGAVEISLEPEGESSAYRADNVDYYISTANNGYKGNLKIAKVPQAFTEQILGQVVDSKDVTIETTEDKTKEFAMAFQFEGDNKAVRHLLYRCSATRPKVGSKTTEKENTPNTEELDFTASATIDSKRIKASIQGSPENKTVYDAWMITPYESTAVV